MSEPLKTKHGGGDIGEALKMLDTFASVGVQYFDLTHTNIEGEKRGFRPKQTLEQICRSLPYLIDSAPRRQNNVIVRPHHAPPVFLLQLDDLNATAIERVRSAALLILNTSPGNFQAWVALREEGRSRADTDFARRLRKGAGADPTASGATRVAGTANFKQKYGPDFPIVAVSSAQQGRTVTRAELDGLGLVAAPEPLKVVPKLSKRMRGKWPSYQYCLDRAPLAHNSDNPDVSRADFTWCMTAIDWGWSIDDTAARLLEESSKAQENGHRYAIETARNAAAAVDRRNPPVQSP